MKIGHDRTEILKINNCLKQRDTLSLVLFNVVVVVEILEYVSRKAETQLPTAIFHLD